MSECGWCGEAGVELVDSDLADGFCAAYHAADDNHTNPLGEARFDSVRGLRVATYASL